MLLKNIFFSSITWNFVKFLEIICHSINLYQDVKYKEIYSNNIDNSKKNF